MTESLPPGVEIRAADDALRAVFGGKDKVTMFEMTKLVSQHIQG